METIVTPTPGGFPGEKVRKSMNRVEESGRLVRDPEVRQSQGANAMAIARFTLAVDRRGKDTGADFIPCVAFGKTAEFMEKYFRKGMKVIVCGHLQSGSYEKNGQKVYTLDVVADEVEFAESKASGTGTAQASTPASSVPAVDADGFMTIPDGLDEEMPFV